MKNIETDVAIIGAGSAGISAMRQVRKSGGSFVLIDHGPLGTVCARIGCMPSKALLHVANDIYRRRFFREEGVRGAEGLECDLPAVLKHVRDLRDDFTLGMVKATKKMAGDRLITGSAHILGPNRIRVGENLIEAQSIVIATGSSPIIPGPWRRFGDRVLTSADIFERKTLPGRIGVIGLGAIGLELGQALSRLGVDITAFSLLETVGGLSDPEVNSEAVKAFASEFPTHLGSAAEVEEDGDTLVISSDNGHARVDALLVAVGVAPNLAGLGLDNLGVSLDERGLPPFDGHTTRIDDLPVFIAGDVNGCRPILHEAVDEGFIAGGNAVADDAECFRRRVPLRIVFSAPQIAVVGESRRGLEDADIVVGSSDFSDQSRAVIEKMNKGLMHIYAEASEGRILGAEMSVPGAEHFGHILALAIQQEMNVFDLLRMPFYHPTLEEGLRTALRDIAGKISERGARFELSLCGSQPESEIC